MKHQPEYIVMADYLDICLATAEKQACAVALKEFLSDFPLEENDLHRLTGQLLAQEVITRGNYEKVNRSNRNTSEVRST